MGRGGEATSVELFDPPHHPPRRKLGRGSTSRALALPRSFQALKADQAEALRESTGSARELFVLADDSGYQIALFSLSNQESPR